MNTKSDTDDTESEDLSTRRPAVHGQSDCEGAMHDDHTSISAAARQPLGRRARTTLALVATLLVALVGGLPSAGAPAGLGTTDATRVVVEVRDDLAAVTRAVVRQGGRVLKVMAPFPLLVAEVPAGTADDLAADPATGSVTPDVRMQVQSLAGRPDQAAAAASSHPRQSAPDAGEGVGVVVVDTGIADHPDLAGRVDVQYALADAGPGDDHGHGTFMAGLVAGDGEAIDGVAPAAHLVSVRVADENGTTSLSTLLDGLVIADAAREQHDAPVVLLAISGPRDEVPDPVMIVLEMLWSRGSTVVVASGNKEALSSPGWDPYVITAGALDDGGTRGRGDDHVPDWSGRGAVEGFGDGWSKPDVVAPAVSVVSLRAAGSTIDTGNPNAQVDDVYFRGTGTSMAAATTAGAAAAVLAANPDLTPDQVKGLLRDTALPVPRVDGPAEGHGAIDVARAVASAPSGEHHDGNPHVGPLPTPDTDGETAEGDWTWDGWNWDGSQWTGWNWDGSQWTGWNWDGSQWTGWNWDGWNWDGSQWTGWNWDGWNWDGWNWDAAGWGDGPA